MVTGGDIRLLPEPHDRYIATQTGTLLALACTMKNALDRCLCLKSTTPLSYLQHSWRTKWIFLPKSKYHFSTEKYFSRSSSVFITNCDLLTSFTELNWHKNTLKKKKCIASLCTKVHCTCNYHKIVLVIFIFKVVLLSLNNVKIIQR